MKHTGIWIAILLFSVTLVVCPFATSVRAASGAGVPIPVPQPTVYTFDESIREIKELRNDFVDESIKLEQPLKRNLITDDIAAVIRDLNTLKQADKFSKLSESTKESIGVSLRTLLSFKSRSALTIDDTAVFQNALDTLSSEAIAADEGCVDGQERRVIVTTLDASGNANLKYKVLYRLAGVRNSAVQLTPLDPQKGDLTPLESKLKVSNYYFWTQDPIVSTRQGSEQKIRLCERDAAFSLPVPQ